MSDDYFGSIPDELDAVFEAAKSSPGAAPVAPPSSYRPTYTEPCGKCGGSGRYRNLGPCFACKGKGSRTFATPAADRAADRAARRERKARTLDEQVVAWKEAHPALWQWLDSRAGRFRFASEMHSALLRFGSLTERQEAAVARLAAEDAQRDAEREAAKAAQAEAAPAVQISRIEQAFDAARASGLKRIHLRLGGFDFKPAGPSSRYPGAVFVTAGRDEYLGRVHGGRFIHSRACSSERMDAILAAIADPQAAAVAYGKRFGACAICGRELSDPVSVERGIGPICAGRFGW